ncbi:hypothetical protein ELI38_27255 (plasmid) [Rhizobium leguminosarum]|uniref:YcaO-like family protein n=1 Tax=Rhizobium TaxID=379 RepID=UPI0003A972D5|nr:YcaO-like family protein [Rhizobium leguminosarum]QIO75514.1 hypothetical protein HA459_26095 [Rhizobium leguminosarum bv. trifolii]AVC46238.1 hypothetical protein RLV_0235 [Rhizobium leguminosarum bv. viciae]MBY5464068.1 hypothetical protein [Rhizobium leguminosarum]MBY5528327.1 hypothetical protein [Rhizobium leguminosarum]MBY5903304.1 hypothetical protein [Rhizobium leguminosarum]
MQHVSVLESVLDGGPLEFHDPWQTVQRILARKHQYGITRLGSVTELDWIRIPVVQVVRPESLSVSVNQGKGLTFPLAAISALMESLEGWASERISSDIVTTAPFSELNKNMLWSYLDAGDSIEPLSWIAGVDLLSGNRLSVPLALVDTTYTFPSPHPRWMPRDTTGLAAGTSVRQATIHACLEILERHARCKAMRTPHFFDRYQVASRSVTSGSAGEILEKLNAVGFTVGIWQIPAPHELPVYWCQIMEGSDRASFAPLPGEGFGCDLSHDRALTKALLEACQSRLGVISAAREDIRTELYGNADATELTAWRKRLASGGRLITWQEPPVNHDRTFQHVLKAMQLAGARAVALVMLYTDDEVPLHVVRVVAPPLETNPEIYYAQ